MHSTHTQYGSDERQELVAVCVCGWFLLFGLDSTHIHQLIAYIWKETLFQSLTHKVFQVDQHRLHCLVPSPNHHPRYIRPIFTWLLL